MDMEHDQALWSDGPKTQSQTHTSNRKSMRDMYLLDFKIRVHLTDQVGALIGPLAPAPQNEEMVFVCMSILPTVLSPPTGSPLATASSAPTGRSASAFFSAP